MSAENKEPRFREHLHEMKEALTGLGKDVRTDVADAPHVAKEGAKNAFARAAGIRRAPMKEWSEPSSSEDK